MIMKCKRCSCVSYQYNQLKYAVAQCTCGCMYRDHVGAWDPKVNK